MAQLSTLDPIPVYLCAVLALYVSQCLIHSRPHIDSAAILCIVCIPDAEVL